VPAWTLTEEAAAALDGFFENEVLGCRDALEAAIGGVAFPAPDPGAESYFIRRVAPRLSGTDLQVAPEDPAAGIRYLEARWAGPERALLVELVAKMFSLAPLFETDESSSDVSPLVYVMF
jgi:hypothetical protein